MSIGGHTFPFRQFADIDGIIFGIPRSWDREAIVFPGVIGVIAPQELIVLAVAVRVFIPPAILIGHHAAPSIGLALIG